MVSLSIFKKDNSFEAVECWNDYYKARKEN